MLQCNVEEFSKGQAEDTEHVLAIAIVTIGETFKFDTTNEVDQQKAVRAGYTKPTKSTVDESELLPQYILTAIDSGVLDSELQKEVAKEPLALTEYCCRLATDNKVHVIQFDECVDATPNPLT